MKLLQRIKLILLNSVPIRAIPYYVGPPQHHIESKEIKNMLVFGKVGPAKVKRRPPTVIVSKADKMFFKFII